MEENGIFVFLDLKSASFLLKSYSSAAIDAFYYKMTAKGIMIEVFICEEFWQSWRWVTKCTKYLSNYM